MPPTGRPSCEDVEAEIAALVSGDVGPSRVAALHGHIADCAACARTETRERRLLRLLEALPSPPEIDLPVPALPDSGGGRVVRPAFRAGSLAGLRWAAAAAAAAVVAAVWAFAPAPSGREVPVAGLDVRNARFVDVDDPFPSWDDGLLSLAGSAEAVVSRRVAEGR